MKSGGRFLILFILLVAGIHTHAALVIDSIASTASSCQNNGTVTVYARDSVAISYAITGGPVTRPGQVSNILSALPPGSYTVHVSDVAGHVLTRAISISGSYTAPALDPIVIYPRCRKTNDFILVGNDSSGTGLPPFMWQLVAPSPVTAGPQSSDSFPVNAPGTYTIVCTDACGSVQTRQFSFTNVPASNLRYNYDLDGLFTTCDSVYVEMGAQIIGDSSDLIYPLTLTLTNGHGGVATLTETNPLIDTFVYYATWGYFITKHAIDMATTIAHTDWRDSIYAIITDGCGDSVVNYIPIDPPVIVQYSLNLIDSCMIHNSTEIDYNLPTPNHWILRNANTNTYTVVDSSRTPSSTGSFFTNLIIGTQYNFICYDQCGDTLQQNFVYAPQSPPSPSINPVVNVGGSCLDSTASVTIFYSGFTSAVTVELLSGPSGAHSSKPGFTYSQTYTYPKTFIQDAPPYVISSSADISDIAPGHYVFAVQDSCGHSITGSFDVTPDEVSSFSRFFGYERGCIGNNTLLVGFPGSSYVSGICTVKDAATNQTLYSNVINGTLMDSVRGIASGAYILSVSFAGSTNLTDSSLCSDFSDTIIVPPYQNPALTPLSTFSCGGTMYIAVEADSSAGVYPYTYSIVSGPQIFPVQTNNLFAIQQTGTYTVLLTDACGNGTSASISVDSLTHDVTTKVIRVDKCFQALVSGHVYTADTVLIDTIRNAMGCDTIVVIDSVFVGGSGDSLPLIAATRDTFCGNKGNVISAVPSYASYLWSDGSTMPSVTVSGAGIYTLTVTDIAGCQLSDTVTVAIVDSPYILSGWIADTSVCTDHPLLLHLSVSTPNATYAWDMAGTQYGLNRTITDSGTYTFTISNQCGASLYTLHAIERQCDENLYVPNAFTPNGDGVDDVFQVFTSYDVRYFSMKIFDRWGEKVYEGNNLAQGWDATYRNAPQPAGVYVYELTVVSLADNTVSKRGSLTLIR